MSLSHTFIPGKWLDQIDVHDFVNLNKKPFLSQPQFLQDPSPEAKKLAEHLERRMLQEKSAVHTSKSSIKTHIPSLNPEIIEIIPGYFSENGQKCVDFTESTGENPVLSLPELFSQTTSTNIKKALKTGLLSSEIGSVFPSMVQPDVRLVPLYGIQALIADKKYYIKKIEDQFQTTEWVERRLSLHEEIKSLEEFKEFCFRYGVDASKPASSAKEAAQMLYLSVLASLLENPSVPFCLPDFCSFLDIFIERDIQMKKLNESESQELIDVLLKWLH